MNTLALALGPMTATLPFLTGRIWSSFLSRAIPEVTILRTNLESLSFASHRVVSFLSLA